MLRAFNGRQWFAALLALALVVVAGCQPVSGIDLNRMLKQSLKTTSVEGSQSLELQLLFSEEATAALQGEDAELIRMLSNIRLDLTDIKTASTRAASMNGKLTLGDLSIGFAIKIDGNLLSVELDDAKEPFVFELDPETLSALSGEEVYLGIAGEISTPGSPVYPGATANLDEQTEAELVEMGKTLVDQIGGYAIDNLPNPERLTVNLGASAEVGGEQLSLTHVQAEINGPELWQWVKAYLDALIADESGLSQMLTEVLATVGEHKETIAAAGLPLDEMLPLGDIEAADLEEAARELTAALREARAALDSAEADDPETIAAIFNEQTFLKADLYLDDKLDIRKSAVELVVRPQLPEEAALMMGGFEGVRIAVSGEQWNVNGDVQAEPPIQPSQGITIPELAEMESYEFVRLFDKNSSIYDLLKNKLELSRQTVYLDTEYTDYPPIVTPDGVTIVPLREVASQLGAEVKYDAASRSVVLNDKATGMAIAFQTGSRAVQVNGEERQWGYPATVMHDGALYVPARDLIAALGGTLHWEQYEYAGDMLVMERDIE